MNPLLVISILSFLWSTPVTWTVQPCAYSSLQDAINAAVCGDTINLLAGQTWDTSTPYSLANKSCTTTPITIQSTNAGSLPSGRIGPGDVSNMPRVRSTGSNATFVDVSGGSYWVLDGLEITDNSTTDIPILVDLRNGGKTKLSRIYGHPKEVDPDWSRSSFRAIWYEGSGGLTVERGYWSGFLGCPYAIGSGTCTGANLNTSEVLLSIGGKNVTLTNNYLQA